MSSNFRKIKCAPSYMAWGEDKAVVVCDSSPNIGYQFIPAQSNNTSQLTFQINVPQGAGLSKLIMYNVQGTATFAGTAPAGGDVGDGVIVGLSDSCMDQVIQNEVVKMGQIQNNVNRSLIGVELKRVNVSSELDTIFRSGSPAMKDYATSFAPWINTVRNVLSPVYNTPVSDQCPSPRCVDIQITATNATSITVAFNVWFASAVSPFCESFAESNAIRGLSTVLNTLNFESSLLRMFSIYVPATYTLTGLTSIAFDNCNLVCRFITPSPFSLKNYNPSDDVYKITQCQTWVQQVGLTVPARTSSSRSTGVANLTQIQGSVVPRLLLILVREIQSLLPLNGATSPRWWAPVVLTNNLSWNNVPILQGATTRDLYQMSVKNGLSQTTFEQFEARDVTYSANSYTDAGSYVLGGSPLVLSPREFNIANGAVAGTTAPWTLSGSLTFANPTYSNISNLELVVCALFDGTLTVNNNNTSLSLGLLSVDQALATLSNDQKPITDVELAEMQDVKNRGYLGGSFFSKIKSLGNKAIDYAATHPQQVLSAFNKAKSYFGKGYESDEEFVGGAVLDTSSHAVESKRNLSRKYFNKH
jgi:hypothetical protein